MKKILQFLKDNNLFVVIPILVILYYVTIFIVAIYFGGGPGIIPTVYLSYFIFIIFIFIFGLGVIIDSIRKPNTKIPTLILVLFFCFNVTVNKLMFIFLCLLCLCVLIIFNRRNNNDNLRFSGIVIILLTILINVFVIRNNSSHENNSILTNKSGYNWKYCPEGKPKTCKIYKIPKNYNKITPLYREFYKQEYACPYFEVYKNSKITADKMYIDINNQQILKEFDTVEYIDKPAYFYKSHPEDFDNYYFKVSKNGKYGLYELNKFWCDKNKLIIPCEYGYDDIQLEYNDTLTIGHGLQFIITKKNGLYNLYARSRRYTPELYELARGNYKKYTQDYRLLYKNKKNIKILKDSNKPYIIKSYGNIKKYGKSELHQQELNDFVKVQVDDEIIYIHTCSIEEPLDKNNAEYKRIDFDCI